MTRRPRSATLFTRGPAACAACHWVRRWLEHRGVAVNESDIHASPAARDELLRLTNAELPVPTVLLPDGRVLVWPGPPTLEAVFGGGATHERLTR
jgi:glutaredoxin